mgnify:CR=1 FL=1
MVKRRGEAAVAGHGAGEQEMRDQESCARIASWRRIRGRRTGREARAALKIIKAFVRHREPQDAKSLLRRCRSAGNASQGGQANQRKRKASRGRGESSPGPSGTSVAATGERRRVTAVTLNRTLLVGTFLLALGVWPRSAGDAIAHAARDRRRRPCVRTLRDAGGHAAPVAAGTARHRVRAHHHPVFPTVTRVNGASFVTGSYPETHGSDGQRASIVRRRTRPGA